MTRRLYSPVSEARPGPHPPWHLVPRPSVAVGQCWEGIWMGGPRGSILQLGLILRHGARGDSEPPQDLTEGMRPWGSRVRSHQASPRSASHPCLRELPGMRSLHGTSQGQIWAELLSPGKSKANQNNNKSFCGSRFSTTFPRRTSIPAGSSPADIPSGFLVCGSRQRGG